MNGIFKHFVWGLVVLISVAILCATIVNLNSNPYAVRFEMDNNTLEAVKTISSMQNNFNITYQEKRCDTINVTVYNYRGESIGYREAELCMHQAVYDEVDATKLQSSDSSNNQHIGGKE